MQDARLEELPYEECLRLLRENAVGRISVVMVKSVISRS